jgi:peptide/nickel transport system substrate-binding protein
MLAKVGINAKIENVEWAQWLAGPFKGNFDLTIINHVEPLDYATAYADPNYYFGYDSAKFRGLVATLAPSATCASATACGATSSARWPRTPSTPSSGTRRRWRCSARGLRGLWNSSPIFANDMAAVSWQAAG